MIKRLALCELFLCHKIYLKILRLSQLRLINSLIHSTNMIYLIRSTLMEGSKNE